MPSEVRSKSILTSALTSALMPLALTASVLLLVLLTRGRSAQGKGTDRREADEEVEAMILKMEQEKAEALKKGGDAITDWENRVFADHVICFGSGFSGACSEAEVVAEHPSGQRRLRTVRHDDYRVQVYGTPVRGE